MGKFRSWLYGGGVAPLLLIVVFALVMVSFSGCGKSGEKKMYAGSSRENAGGNTNSTTQSPGASDRKPAMGAGFGGGGDGFGGGGGLLDDPIPPDEWDVRAFTDPRTGQTYDIIDGRVLIAFRNPPVLPDVDPNYYDVERFVADPNYGGPYPPVTGDQQIDAFVAAENLTVRSEWLAVRGMLALLPEGQTVEDAVANWPGEYPQIVEAVDPDAIIATRAWPLTDPNDPQFPYQYNLNEEDPGQPEAWDINIQAAWRMNCTHSAAIAILDTGCERGKLTPQHQMPDMYPALLSWGVNTYGNIFQTKVGPGYGEPDKQLLDRNALNKMHLGHGTCVASVIGAWINNGGVPSDHTRDVCGIVESPPCLPVAMEANYYGYDQQGNPLGGFSESAITTAMSAIGCIKRVYTPWREFYGMFSFPYLNIEVVDCSWGSSKPMSTLMARHIGNLAGCETPGVTRYGAMLFVCAESEKDTDTQSWPSDSQFVMAVTAHNSSGGRPEHYRYVAKDLYAPGVNVCACDMEGQYGYDSLSPWLLVSGTSFATSHVSVVAGMVSLKYPLLWPSEVRARIENHSVYIGVFPYRRLDAYGALFGQ